MILSEKFQTLYFCVGVGLSKALPMVVPLIAQRGTLLLAQRGPLLLAQRGTLAATPPSHPNSAHPPRSASLS